MGLLQNNIGQCVHENGMSYKGKGEMLIAAYSDVVSKYSFMTVISDAITVHSFLTTKKVIIYKICVN